MMRYTNPRTERLLDRAVTNRERLVTDTEVFQEILHRYTAIDRREAIQPAWIIFSRALSRRTPPTTR